MLSLLQIQPNTNVVIDCEPHLFDSLPAAAVTAVDTAAAVEEDIFTDDSNKAYLNNKKVISFFV